MLKVKFLHVHGSYILKNVIGKFLYIHCSYNVKHVVGKTENEK